MKTIDLKWFMILILFVSANIFAQQSGYFVPTNIQKAVKKGTRSMNGLPGAKYFQNRANYKISVEFDPATGLLQGYESIEYINNSPDSLRNIVIRLYQNYLKSDALRQSAVEKSDLHDGVEIISAEINGQSVDSAQFHPYGTNMIISLKKKMSPGGTMNLAIKWRVQLPNKTLIRMGRYDTTSYFVAYWYPQIAVYDDLSGWCLESYTGLQEFYNEYGDFEVEVKVPKDYVVWATGELQNPKELFQPEILKRIQKASTSDEVVQIIKPEDLTSKKVILPAAKGKWNFKAKNVSDFAFGVSDNYVWDGVSAVVDSMTGRRANVNAVYKNGSKAGQGVAAIGRTTIIRLSTNIMGVPYPYPHNTIWEGHFGREFPMMSNDGPFEEEFDKVFVTSHEVSHSYFPFLVGTNEIHNAWIDEGLITFLPKAIELEYGNANAHHYLASYGKYAMGTSWDIPLSVPTTQMNEQTYMMQNYGRAAVGFYFLHDMLGNELFSKVIKEYITRWKGKHPTPTDLALTFNAVTGQDWSWYWNPWFYNYGYADLALADVEVKGANLKLKVLKKGSFPVPVKITLTFADNTTTTIYHSAIVWRDAAEFVVEQKFDKEITKVSLGDKNIPDAFPEDNRNY